MEDPVYIPIPHYPPFKLRSSLVDKDPVIWVHLLEGYIKLCKVLLSGQVQLTVKSQQQLQLFVKVFLQETSEETSKIFSLGAINPDIKANTAELRAYVFQLIKEYSVVKLALSGESLWNFVLVYVAQNATLVRLLVAGTHKSPMNDNKKSGKISLIPVLRKHLLAEMSLGKLTADHLAKFSLLLGQHTAAPVLAGRKVLAKDKYNTGRGSSALQFAEQFVTQEWIEGLELLYVGGKSIHAATIKNWMIVSVLALSPAKLANVFATLGINGADTLSWAPLLSSIVVSDVYKKLNPGLEERLPFLNKLVLGGEPVNQKDIDFLVEMFPTLTPKKARTIIAQNDGDVEKVTHLLLEQPYIIETIPEDEPAPKVKPSAAELERGMQRFSLNTKETTEQLKKESKHSAQDTKNRTLTAALRLLYESDEDERDDTYDDQELTSGLAMEERRGNKSRAKLAVYDEQDEESSTAQSPAVSAPAEYDKNELILFGYLRDKEASLEKTARKTKVRAEIRSATGWTDEQIEGWARMLKKSPKRFRLLEEQYVFHNSNRRAPVEQDYVEDSEVTSNASSSSNGAGPSKRAAARKEKNKASRANHSRKSGHNKKTRSELLGMQ